jgi:L-fuconolactonase
MAKRTQPFPAIFGNRLARDYTPADLLPELRAAGIDGTILVQSLNDLDETNQYLDLADTHHFIKGVVGWVPLADPAGCARSLDTLAARRRFVGVRHLMNYEPDADWLTQPRVLESLHQLAGRHLVFEAIPVNDRQLESVINAAQQVADLTIVLNHLGRPPVPENSWEPWGTQMTRAASCPNMSVKLSAGGDLVARWTWSTDQIRRYVDHVLDAFGPNRIVAASNWPVVLLGGTFAEVWAGITQLIGSLSPAERAAILGLTAERIYGLAA